MTGGVTEDVVALGDDRPPRRLGGLVAGLATVALLAVGVAGALRSPSDPEPRASASPTPSASFTAGWTEYPTGEPDPFEVFVSAHRPEQGGPAPLLLERGVPVFLVDEGGLVAYEAVGGPAYAPIVLSWCQRLGILQDRAGRYRFLAGMPMGPYPGLRTYPVRPSAGADDHVDIGLLTREPRTDGTAEVDEECTSGELVDPPLPGAVTTIAGTARGYARMRGRYVVSTETRAFCPAGARTGCASSGWEQYGPLSVLPPGDLAGSYTWEGEFLVRTEPELGGLSVVLLRDTRLVARERVGVKVRVGWAETSFVRDGALHLRFNPFAARAAGVPDDSPPGTRRPSGQWYGDLSDRQGGLVEYVVRPDAEIHLGQGRTGLGLPRGTPETLRKWIADTTPYESPPLWLVFDKAGKVIRVVADREDVVD